MAKYIISPSIGGKFIQKSELKTGMKATLVGETTPIPSSKFSNPKTGEPVMQNVSKVKVEGLEGEFNVNLNKTNIACLVAAFGDESNDWIGKPLTVDIKETEDNTGAIVYKLLLLPDGYVKTYEKGSDGKMYAKIIKG